MSHQVTTSSSKGTVTSVNRILLRGYVGANPTYRRFFNATLHPIDMWSFSLATHRYTKKVGSLPLVRETDWHTVKDFSTINSGMYVDGSIRKGALVEVDGRIKYSKAADGSIYTQVLPERVSVIKQAV